MKRSWGIRHIRYFYLAYKLAQWVEIWAQTGVGLGCPNQSDLDYLDAVWRGEA